MVDSISPCPRLNTFTPNNVESVNSALKQIRSLLIIDCLMEIALRSMQVGWNAQKQKWWGVLNPYASRKVHKLIAQLIWMKLMHARNQALPLQFDQKWEISWLSFKLFSKVVRCSCVTSQKLAYLASMHYLQGRTLVKWHLWLIIITTHDKQRFFKMLILRKPSLPYCRSCLKFPNKKCGRRSINFKKMGAFKEEYISLATSDRESTSVKLENVVYATNLVITARLERRKEKYWMFESLYCMMQLYQKFLIPFRAFFASNI